MTGRDSRPQTVGLPLAFDELFVDTVLLVGLAVLASWFVAGTLHLQQLTVSPHTADVGHRTATAYFSAPAIDARIRDSRAASDTGTLRRRDLRWLVGRRSTHRCIAMC